MTEPDSNVRRLRLQLVQWLLVVLLVGAAAIVVRFVVPFARGSRSGPATLDELSRRLGDPSGDVQASAIGDLASRARMGDARAARMLEYAAVGDAEVGIRQVALEALAEACPDRAVVLLVRIAADPAEAIWARKRAIGRLGLMGRGESVAVLLSLARKGESEVRDAARNALAAFGVPDDTQRNRELRKKMLMAIVNLQFTDIDLRDTITFSREYSDASIVIIQPAATAKAKPLDGSAKVTIDLRNVPIGYFLWEVIRQVRPDSHWGLRWFGDVMAIELVEGAPDPTDWDVARPAGNNPADMKVFDKLQVRIERLAFEDISLSDVIDFLRDYSEAPIEVDWRGLKGIAVVKGSYATVDVRDVTVAGGLRMALASVIASGKITCEIRDGKLVVSAKR